MQAEALSASSPERVSVEVAPKQLRLRGKAAFQSVQVHHNEGFMNKAYNLYIHALRLPLPMFLLIMLVTPLFLSFFFTGFYLLDSGGVHIPDDRQAGMKTWWDCATPCHAEKRFKIFIFSLSLSTTFGGTRVEARSPYTLLLANLNTLLAQLIFVFLSGAESGGQKSSDKQPCRPLGTLRGLGYIMQVVKAVKSPSSSSLNESSNGGSRGKTRSSVSQNRTIYAALMLFHRLSQPSEPVRWSKIALITDDQYTDAETRVNSPGNKIYKSFLIRLNLVDPKHLTLIECKFELIYRRIILTPGQISLFVNSMPLKLVRPEVSHLKYGLLMRHVIDEQSPLFEASIEAFHAQDVSFTATVSALERSSMQPVFSEHFYSVSDGDIVWDRQFEDQILTDKLGRSVFHTARLHNLRPLEGDGGKQKGRKKQF